MVMKKRYYADGGKVETPPPKPKPKPKPEPPPPKPDPKMLGSGGAARAGAALRDRRAEQMRELGLKDGGKVKRKKKRR